MTSDTGRRRPRLHDRARDAMRDAVRAEVVEQALLLFDERGFDETTVQDIAVAAGISPRSFFRYFPAKEDVVIGDLAPLGLMVRDALTARPSDEPLWPALRASFSPLLKITDADPARGLRTMRVMMSAPSLRARNLEKHIVWANLIAPVIAGRLAGPADSRDFRAQTLVHAALSCLDAAFAEWTHRDGNTASAALLDEAFATVNDCTHRPTA